MSIFAYEAVEPCVFHQSVATAYGGEPTPGKSPLSTRTLCSGTRYVRVEIREDILHRLIDSSGLVVEHLRGLDHQARDNIRALLLDSLRVGN